MATKVERRQSERVVEDLIERFVHAGDPREVEVVAGSLGEARDARAIRPLLMRLGDDQVRHDPDVEDALCRALVALGVMSCSGSCSFRLRPRSALTADVVAGIREFSGVIPWEYYGTRCIWAAPTA